MQLGPEVPYRARREVSTMGLLVLSSLCLAGRRYITDTVPMFGMKELLLQLLL
jgi:hypothetical protein